jgi:hypothetical protein
LLALYTFVAPEPCLAFIFSGEVEGGQLAPPINGEITEVGWFDPHHLPTPVHNTARQAIVDACHKNYGVIRDIPT